MDAARLELRDVLLDARSLIALPDNDFAWSSWEGPEAAFQEIDGLVVALDCGQTPSRLRMSVLFAPTGSIQEMSLSSGWADEFLALASRFDAVEKAFYSGGTWWRIMNWRPGNS